MKSKLVIFDLDDCLVDTWGAITPILIQQAIKAMIKAGLKVKSFKEAVAKLREINNRSKNGTEAIKEFLAKENANAQLLEAGKKGFYNFDFNYTLQALPGTREMLKNTKADFALVTKGDWRSQIEKLQKVGIDPKLFKKIIAVPEYNKKKYYQQLLQELDYSPQDCFVCGDRYETDLLPAKQLGIKTIYIPWGRGKINPPPEGGVSYSITNLKEIISLVNKEERKNMNNYKVCILAAGVGNRMENFTRTFNKALIPVQGKPTICHIIEKFPEDIEIVIAIGYKKETLIDYLTIMYPQRKLNFIEVDRYEGPGTGPGYSLLQCKNYLQYPFIFFAADTLVTEDVPAPNENWFGLAEVPNTERFCSAKVEEGKVIRIDDKIKVEGNLAFIGLAGVSDFEHFWKALEKNKDLISGEIQVSNGFGSLIEKELFAKTFTWFDTGTPTSYKLTLENYPHGQPYRGE